MMRQAGRYGNSLGFANLCSDEPAFSSLLPVAWMCVGLAAVLLLGMDMDSPLTWGAIVLWPAVLAVKSPVLFLKFLLAMVVLGWVLRVAATVRRR